MTCAPVILQVGGVSKWFGGLQAVNNVSFEVPEGSIVGLIGPNGAGKSTLFDLISGVQPCTSGRVCFAGNDVTGRKPHVIASLGMSRTFQTVRLFPGMSVLDNAVVGAFLHEGGREQARARAEESLKMVDMYEKRDRETSSLTLVDRKRLEMARALGTQPKLLLLDEVMCGLNPQEMTVAVDLVRSLSRAGVTLIMVEHLLKVIMGLCQCVLVLDHGELIANGTPEEVRRDPRVIAAYIGAEASHA